MACAADVSAAILAASEVILAASAALLVLGICKSLLEIFQCVTSSRHIDCTLAQRKPVGIDY
jgi:hypothetical protein